MPTFALVNYHSRVPVSKYAFTTAPNSQIAFKNFKRKRSKINPKRVMFPNLDEDFELGKVAIALVPPTYTTKVQPPPPKEPARQMTLDFESFKDFIKR